MPPHRIIIVRHSEREDQVNPEFGKTTPRPHDTPLTKNGIQMASKLGSYLAHEYGVHSTKDHPVVVLTSPLLRCVQTSHSVVDALLEYHARSAPEKEDHFIPIYLEPSIMEGATWLMFDMQRNPSVANPSMLKVPEPLYYDAAHFHRHCSTYVRVEKPFSLGGDPTFHISPTKIIEKDFLERNARGARGVLDNLELDGKTVILVGHGETTLVWYSLFTGNDYAGMPCPPYTGFVVLKPEKSSRKTVESKWVPEGPIFITDHLKHPAPRSAPPH